MNILSVNTLAAQNVGQPGYMALAMIVVVAAIVIVITLKSIISSGTRHREKLTRISRLH